MVNEVMSERRLEIINIHQLLHGYDDGHRLLAGSTKPEGPSAKTILTLSDLSGQNGEPGPTGYLTGYPLPHMNAYAIARTWLAPEMSRPGCVWTQTLLVDFSDLVFLNNFSLLKLFKRPRGINDIQTYNHYLTLDTRSQSQSSKQLPLSTIIDLMVALYEHPNVSVFAPVYEDMQVDEIAFVLWLQQWPKLRRNFRFCTWTGSDRSRPGEQFDLQFIPLKSISIGKGRNERDKFWVDFVTPLKTVKTDSFNIWAMELLSIQENNSLNKFLWRFGAEANSGRADFIPLATAWEAFEETPEVNIESAICAVKSLKPPILSLTRQVLEKLVQFSDKCGIINKSAVEFLVDNLSLLEGQISDNDITKIAQIILRNTPKYIWTFFQSDSALRYSIAVSAAKLLSPEDALQGSKYDPELFCAAVEANLNLANSTSVWDAPDPIPERIAEILYNHSKLSTETLAFMLEADSDKIPSIAINVFGQKAVDAALERFDSCKKQHKLNKWLLAAKEHPELLLTAVDQGRIKSMKTLALAASHAKYYSPPLSNTRDEWYRGITTAEGDLGDYSFQFHAFLLARALCGISPEPATLIKYSFDSLHNDLLKSKRDEDAWIMLKSELPEVSVFISWDLAYRLRNGVIQTFIRNDLPPKDFIELTKDDNTFKKMLKNAALSSAGRDYLEKVLKWAQNNSGKVISHRLAMTEKVVEQNRKWLFF